MQEDKNLDKFKKWKTLAPLSSVLLTVKKSLLELLMQEEENQK